MKFEPGSFRDRSSRVANCGDQVLRLMNAESLSVWRRVSQEPFFREMTAAGQIVGTEELSASECQERQLPASFAGLLRHEPIPFVSYPYEWSFGMLREAALLHLRIMTKALGAGLVLKDASPYNVQFRGTQPVFIDIGSFTEQVPGEPWSAYRQFCELMLFPLLLQAYRQVHFQPVLRAQLEGISAQQFLQWMRWRDMLRSGVFTHGWLQSLLEQRSQGFSTSTVRELRVSGFQTSFIEQMLKKLTALVERLEWSPPRTQWTEYNDALPHVADDRRIKMEFVRQVCQQKPRRLVWDIGCNDGCYSRIAGESATTVVGMDQDHGCIDRLYRQSRTDGAPVLPLCVDLANQSPGQGWRGRERRRLEERGRPDLVLCLGLIHHLVLSANIPLPEVMDWLSGLQAELVLEFPSKRDAMVQSLLRNKRDQYDDYSLDRLEVELCRNFEIRRRETLPSGERTLFFAVPKPSLACGR
ncbi:MAG: hypothetical protein U0872_15830 [Planctomycetaceae bacterium]